MGHRILKIEKFFQNRVFRIELTIRMILFVKKIIKLSNVHFLLYFPCTKDPIFRFNFTNKKRFFDTVFLAYGF